MASIDEPELLAALVGQQRSGVAGVRALLAEGGVVDRSVPALRGAGRRHGLRPGQVRRLLMVRELARAQRTADTLQAGDGTTGIDADADLEIASAQWHPSLPPRLRLPRP